MNGLASVTVIIGLFSAYAATGSLVLCGWNAVSSLMIASGVLLKVYVAPVHVWIGQRYAGAAVEVAGFLALVPTLSMLAAWHVLGCIATAGWTFAVAGSACMLLGPVLAWHETRLLGLAGYAATVHSGFMLLVSAVRDVGGLWLYLAPYFMGTVAAYLSLPNAAQAPSSAGKASSSMADGSGMWRQELDGTTSHSPAIAIDPKCSLTVCLHRSASECSLSVFRIDATP